MGWPRSSRLTPLGLAAVLFAQACGSGTPGGSERGTIAFSLTPAAATLQVGGLVQVTGTIVRGGGFTGAVAITVEGAPTGVTGSLDAGTSITASTAVVRIGAGADAVPGTYQLTVRAKATGLTDATATFVLTVAPAASSYYLLTVDTSPLAVIQGTAVVTSIGILRVAGFAGSVTFTAEGLPAGVIAAFNPTAVTGLGTALTFTVGSSVVPGSYSIVIRGTVAGRTDVTAAVTLVVSASPTFSIAAGSNYLNVLQGNGGVTYVKASRSAGFTATASYTISGAPAGLGATIAATVVTDSLTLTVTTTAGLAPGTYPLVIHANATGIAERTTTVNIIVAATAGVNVRLDFSACPQTFYVQAAIWVAYQDGSGPWTRVTGTGGVYTFHINSATGGIAVVRGGVQTFTTSVQYLTQPELQAATASCGDDFTDVTSPYPGGSKTVNGTLTQLVAGDYAQVAMGTANVGDFGIIGPATTYQLSQVVDGPQDLLAYRTDNVTNSTRDRMVIRRDLNIADGGTIAPIDFDGAQAFAPATANFPATGTTPGGGTISAYLDYLSGANCTPNRFTPRGFNGVGVTGFGVPAAQQRAGDYHALTLTDNGNYTGGFRYVRSTFHLFAARALGLGAVMPTTATITTLPGTYRRLQAAFTPPSDYTTAGLYYHDGLGHVFFVTASAAFRGPAAATLTVPDLSAVTGYTTATWAPSVAAQVRIFGKATTQTSACSEGTTQYADQVVPVGP